MHLPHWPDRPARQGVNGRAPLYECCSQSDGTKDREEDEDAGNHVGDDDGEHQGEIGRDRTKEADEQCRQLPMLHSVFIHCVHGKEVLREGPEEITTACTLIS